MPGISRFKQVAAEAKFNVTTECAYSRKAHLSVLTLNPTPSVTNLGLHSAAASGDYGLVKYALTNGQPINSVLHGVLPIHVACSGGDEQVVNLLIENGADVNAPRYMSPRFPPAPPLIIFPPLFSISLRDLQTPIFVRSYQGCPYDTPATRTGTLPHRSSGRPVLRRFISLAQTVTSIL